MHTTTMQNIKQITRILNRYTIERSLVIHILIKNRKPLLNGYVVRYQYNTLNRGVEWIIWQAPRIQYLATDPIISTDAVLNRINIFQSIVVIFSKKNLKLNGRYHQNRMQVHQRGKIILPTPGVGGTINSLWNNV